MKWSQTRFIAASIIALTLLFPFRSYANTELGESLSSIVKARVTLKTNKKKRVTIGKVKITNKTRKKTGQPVYGGMTLVITSISKPTVTLKNFSGYTANRRPYLLIPHTTPLLPKKSIKGILLEFNNPELKRFKFTYEIYGSLSPSQINKVSPNQASSGTEITLTGQNFTSASTVQMAGQGIMPKSVSGNHLSFIVPFTASDENALLPLNPGQYLVQVDNSNAAFLNVVDLPNNPNPPGQVLNNRINSLSTMLAEALLEFKAVLPKLQEDYINNPEALAFLTEFTEWANSVNQISPGDIAALISQLDPQTLDTLESALLNIGQQPSIKSTTTQIRPQASKNVQNTKAVDQCPMPEGDAWLQCRKSHIGSALEVSQFLGKWGPIIESVCFVPSLVSPPVAVLCTIITSQVAIIKASLDIANGYFSGAIRKLTLNFSYFSLNDKYNDSEGEYSLHINNYYNSSDPKIQPKKTLLGGIISVDKTPGFWSNALTLLSTLKDLTKLKIQVATISIPDILINKLTDYIASEIDTQSNSNDKSYQVTSSVLMHGLTYEFFDHTLIPPISLLNPAFAKPPCNLHDADNYYLMQTIPWESKEWLFAVPDQGAAWASDISNIGDCEVKIADQFRIAAEDDIKSKISFYVKRYAKLTVSVTGDGYIKYSRPTISGKDRCDSGNSPCTEYFEVAIGAQITLAAYKSDDTNATSAIWSGSGRSSGNCNNPTDKCTANLDAKNENPPNITVLLANTQCSDKSQILSGKVAGVWNDSVFNGTRLTLEPGLDEPTDCDDIRECGFTATLEMSSTGPNGELDDKRPGKAVVTWKNEAETPWLCVDQIKFVCYPVNDFNCTANFVPWVFSPFIEGTEEVLRDAYGRVMKK